MKLRIYIQLLFAVILYFPLFAANTVSITGTTVGAPTAIFPLFGSTSGSCTLGATAEPYRLYRVTTDVNATITVNITNIIDAGGSVDDTGLFWYQGAFAPAAGCTNFRKICNDPTGANLTFVATANTTYTLAVVGLFGSADDFAMSLTIPTGTVVLPIELLSFTAKNTEGGGNLLTWATASEKDNSHFDIERSTDGNSFNSIGQVKGNNKPSSYQYTDATPPFGAGGLYYRLRQIDFDGTEAVSKVVSVSLKGSTKSLKVYPTIVSTGILTIDIDGTSTDYREGGQLRDFSVTNLLGQQVLSGKTPPSGTFGLDVSALARGTYIFKVGAEQVKFVKQ